MSQNTLTLEQPFSNHSKIPTPTHRHAAPSTPWPFVDIDDEVDPSRIQDPDSHIVLSAAACDHKQTPDQEVCWCKYPQSFYPNWTPRQQKKAKLTKILERRMERCTIHYLDVNQDGSFVDAGTREVTDRTVDSHWKAIQEERNQSVHVRALFVEGLSGNVLQILGTRYNLEPFFFSSTIGWIPSRHQSNVVPYESDHITITLTFIRPMTDQTTSIAELTTARPRKTEWVIDTHAPLTLRSNNVVLLADQLAVHMVRARTGSTIISLHPNKAQRATSAQTLHDRVHTAGRSVYWGSIFTDTRDPTFVLLSVLWYALYAWDEAQEHLYAHICFLESEVMSTNDAQLTEELHAVRAHLMYFEALLEDFRKTVQFVQDTPAQSLLPREGEEETEEQLRSKETMKRECGNMLTEIARLERSRDLQDQRVKNVMDLVFSMVNIEESRNMQKLTEASMRDSAAIKQISYMTMVFAPAIFVAGVFGMNIAELNPGSYGTLAHYMAIAVPFTIFTIWIIVAYQIQIRDPHGAEGASDAAVERGAHAGSGALLQERRAVGLRRLAFWERLWWPVLLMSTMMERQRLRKERRRAMTRVRTMSTNPTFDLRDG
ncbi:hypothetical protein BJ912DRAFT_979394 [Pholiota molesta]|nr:hypothetical protein BJ912DRAFT_979394 [Pholiota molesta]